MKIARALWPRGLLGRLSIAYLIPTVLFMVGLILLADFAARAPPTTALLNVLIGRILHRKS